MVEYICNRCGFGSDELDEGIDASQIFELKYEEYYCDGCMDEYNSGGWEFPRETQRKKLAFLQDEVNKLNRDGSPTMSQVYNALERIKRDPNDYDAQLILSQVTITPRGAA